MYILLALFFISLAGIIFMIGRKLSLIEGEAQADSEAILFEIPHPEEIQDLTIKSARKYGYLTLVTTLKIYVRSLNKIKEMYNEMRAKSANGDEKKVSKFLKLMSEYKDKIRDIKDKIEKEENR